LSEKDMEEQRAAHECLTTMIVDAKDLFTVRSELSSNMLVLMKELIGWRC